jgi:O-antigen/teichoic acid export membrane protein
MEKIYAHSYTITGDRKLIKKKRIANALLLGGLAEIINKIFPLIVINYAQAKLGMEGFGYAQFGLLMVDLTIPFVLYGYHNYSSIEIGKSSSNKEAVGKIISQIISARLIHAVLASIGLLLFLTYSESYRQYLPVALATIFVLFTGAIDMLPVLIGTQRLKFFSLFSILAKTVSLGLILLLVQDQEDTILYAVITQASNSLISLATLWLCLKSYRLTLPSAKEIWKIFKLASPFSLILLFSYPFERFDLLIVEHYEDISATGLYLGAWKLAQSLTMVVLMIGSVFIAELVIIKDRRTFTEHINLAVWIMITLAATVALGSWFVNSDFLGLVLGRNFSEAGQVFSILLTGAVFYTMFFIFGMQVLMLKKSLHLLVFSLFVGLVVGSLSSLALGSHYGSLGIAIGSVLGKAMAAGLAMYFSRAFLIQLPFVEILKSIIPGLVMFAVLFVLQLQSFLTTLAVGAVVFSLIFMTLNRRRIPLIFDRFPKIGP